MGHRLDITGHVYGRLTVIEESGKTPQGFYIWRCKCSCGNDHHVPIQYLRSGNTKSCGCTHNEARVKRCTTHGLAPRGQRRHKAYVSWAGMKYRCDVPECAGYADYGGRGITYNEKWSTFEGFWEDMGGTWEEGISIDRVDVNGNYTKENCRWASPKEQARNKRTNRLIEYAGEVRCLTEWCEILGLSPKRISARIQRGWPVCDAFQKTKGERVYDRK